ncbi:44052989-d912-4f29-92ae-1b7c3d2083c3-CDS [Sclerotinia trifoliorum]|uniref:44052989-d912-4f29-92ae-1b7c3d2083c3-CDS n=1 Tax=Sclerotinia trifoliorum TaxID=28548 RepID=A0A8H2ZU72_9HELO|nr:44052989-d912-4f29-92ae-1b7c3d2083c3-CDS [Sclerotinia trifoliorum]
MPPLQLRQEFPSLKAFKEALHAWAIEAHFEPRILKSDTGRVRVGCKRDPGCPFVVRCNWERRGGREPLARVTVLRERHTCLDDLVSVGHPGAGVRVGVRGQVNGGLPSGNGSWDGNVGGMSVGIGQNGNGGLDGVGIGMSTGMVVINGEGESGHILPGARVIDQLDGGSNSGMPIQGQVLPVLPKVQRNSASRLPFLMGILPKLMTITKETTPVEIRDCLMREFGAEVHLQQCRRAKTEILKKGGSGDEGGNGQGGGTGSEGTVGNGSGGGSGTGSGSGSGSSNGNNGQGSIQGSNNNTPPTQVLFPETNNHVNGTNNPVNTSMNNGTSTSTPQNTNRVDPPITPNSNPNANPTRTGSSASPQQPFILHTAQGIVIPAISERNDSTLMQTEQPIRCPYCINQRWLRSIKDAVEHLSMHVVV